MSFNIEVEGGSSVRLPTSGKYCDRDIVVTAIGGGGDGGNYDEGYADGQQAEYDRFWDEYQNNGNRTDYRAAFAGAGWKDENLDEPKYGVANVEYADYMFAWGAKNTTADLDDSFANRGLQFSVSGCNSLASMFFQSAFKKIGTIDASAVTSTSNIASIFNSTTITTIRNFIPPKCAMAASCFQSGLATFIVGGAITKDMNLSRCSKLDAASVQSVVDHLADLTGQPTQILTVHQTVRNAMTAEQVNEIVNVKNWTLAPAAATN